ncbi:hypothetical protein FACS189443_3890 [Planctomycetales bacterium]|nr:hypothetical protein FACS189443_3890 [Planctomycetales bacterium]
MLFVFCLSLPLAALAGDIIIDDTSGGGTGTVSDAVWGNGTPPDGTPLGIDPDSAIGNSVTVNSGGTVDTVFGEYAFANSAAATATSNSVTFSGGTAQGGVYGGYACGGGGSTASDNIVNIDYGALVSGDVCGGKAGTFGDESKAQRNQVFIGGQVSGNVYGGQAESYTPTSDRATYNSVTLLPGAAFDTSKTIYGGYYISNYSSGGGDYFSGNTLNVKTSGLAVGNLQNFQFYNFYLPFGAANSTMLNVAGTANIDNSTIGIIGQPDLNLGDSGILISYTAGRPTNLGDYTYNDTSTGVSYGYDLSINASTTTLNFFHNSVNAPGNWIAPHANYTVNSSNGDVSLKVGGVLNGVGTLTLNQNSGNTLTADIHTLDASSNDFEVNLLNTTVWNGTTGVRFNTLELGGGHTFRLNDNGGTGAYTGFSTYNIYGQAAYDGNLDATDGTLNFYIPTTMDKDEIMLNVIGDANIGNSQVNVGVSIDGGSSPLKAGDKVVLIEAATLTANGISV